ncbi:hypothetical protein [Methanoculleus sp. UBA312]|uniref:hypothetical protein n=1 Tax=Methanoculleus sp. UBA312 TaxID=1915499 RepID=UPI0031B9D831
MSGLVRGARVRVLAPSAFRGSSGVVVQHYPPTRNCMVEFPGGRGIAWIADECLEVTG